jgi:hypothetical protein
MEPVFHQLVASGSKYNTVFVNTPADVEQINSFPLGQVTEPNALLYIWASQFQIGKIADCITSWGFQLESIQKIVDIQSYPWQKQSKVETPVVPAEPAVVVEEAQPVVEEEGKKPKKKAAAPKKVKPAVVHPPAYMDAAATVDVLLLAKKGDPSALFTEKQVPQFTSVFAPELGKKKKIDDTSSDRLPSIYEEITSRLSDSSKKLFFFTSTLHADAANYGDIPGTFVESFDTGIMKSLIEKLSTFKKVDLTSLKSKIGAFLKDSTIVLDDTVKTLLDEIETAVLKGSYFVEYKLEKKDDASPKWFLKLIEIAVKHVVSNQKPQKKRKRTTGSGANKDGVKHGIAAPRNVSKEMEEFLGLQPGEQIARTAVVKKINEYVKTNGLQNPVKKIEIQPDEKLLKLLQPEADFPVLTYFNICKLLSKHFIKAEKAPAAAKKQKV